MCARTRGPIGTRPLPHTTRILRRYTVNLTYQAKVINAHFGHLFSQSRAEYLAVACSVMAEKLPGIFVCHRFSWYSVPVGVLACFCAHRCFVRLCLSMQKRWFAGLWNVCVRQILWRMLFLLFVNFEMGECRFIFWMSQIQFWHVSRSKKNSIHLLQVTKIKQYSS